MLKQPQQKYRPFAPIGLRDRTWPDAVLVQAPICYDAVIRVNSQSGKGGISCLLESEFGVELPRRLPIEFGHELRVGDAVTLFGVGIDSNIVTASLKAVTSGLQRALRQRQLRFAALVVA